MGDRGVGAVREVDAVAALARVGSWSAFAFLLVTPAWFVVALMSPRPPDRFPAAERLAFLSAHEGWHVASFLLALPLALLQVPLWIGLAAAAWRWGPAGAVSGGALGLVGVPFTAWAHWSQLTQVRGLVDLREVAPFDAVNLFRGIIFTADQTSLAYGAFVFGGAVGGLGGLVLWRVLRRSPSRLEVLTGGLLGCVGVLGLAGAVGFVARSSLLHGAVGLAPVVWLPTAGAAALLLDRVAASRSARPSPRDG